MATFVCADAILGAVTVTGVTNSSHRGGNTVRKTGTSGGATVSQVSGLLAEEVSTVTSGDIATLLGANSGTFISAGLYVSGSAVTIPFKSRDTGGTFASGTSHSAISGTKALIIPTQIEASQDAEAGASCAFEIHWISATGAAKAATGSAGNALATQAFVAEFSLGPLYFNSSAITGIQSFRINPGITVVKSRADGLPWPHIVSIQSVQPTIEFTTNDIDAVVAATSNFTAMTSAVAYLRKRKDAALFEAAGATVDISFTFGAGLSLNDSTDVSDNNDGTTTVTLHGKTLTTSVAAAIP